jgi:glycosyltransferase involved in cell wall biosynthesis
VFRHADAVAAFSENMKKEIQKISKRDVHIISNGIDLQLFSNLTREQARSDLQIIKDQQIITFVGTLRPVKGVKYLIRAMDIVVRRKAGIRLILIGDGPDRHELEGMTKDLILGNQITFIGMVPHEKVPEFMVASDIFILPSLSEGLPGVIIEAFAAAIPIVATSVGALPEIIREGENGFLVEPKNPEQLAEKILLLLGNSELRNKFSENNKLKSKNYTWDCVVDLLEQRFIDITRKHHLPPLKDHV